jgi:nicotinamidase-related amidase
MENRLLRLSLRTQLLKRDEGGHNYWQAASEVRQWPCARTALLLCDVWDKHWSRGASERVDAMVVRMDQLVRTGRDLGVQIIHTPSGTMESYADTPARQRMLEAPAVDLPDELELEDPPQPIDATDGGSDTGETNAEAYKAWSRQHPGIWIDQQSDGISDNGQEVYNLMAMRSIEHILIMGVHTNMCVLNRSFAIKQMVRWGKDVALVRDLTDAMYNPAQPPYVSHDAGTSLVIEYIEKFWCPSVLSEDILR